MDLSPKHLADKITRSTSIYRQQHREWLMGRQVATHAFAAEGQAPVIFFNASTRLVGMSYNSAYQQVTAWALRLRGIPVIHFVCRSGMSHCVQGTNRDAPAQQPPCQGCLVQSRALYEGAEVAWFEFKRDPVLAQQLEALSLQELMAYVYQGIPLGRLVLPSMRWVLRRYHLIDDQSTRNLYSSYILSAWNIATEFIALIEKAHPQAIVVFNGIFFPEAVVTWVARQQNLPVVSHESGFTPFSGFFTWGNATSYPLDPPKEFMLSSAQESRLDDYLSHRFKGDFSVAGIRFWPEIKSLDPKLLEKMAGFEQMVPVFTNVIFDTSQEYANGIFADMFVWLEALQKAICAHPRVLFVIRAHPDEGRKGKASRETVANWIHQSGMDTLPNVVFIDSNEFVSSYELVQRANLVLVYNSSIGLEASILGKPVLCAGKVRYYTPNCPTVLLPDSQAAYFSWMEDLLQGKPPASPENLQANARRFQYYQLYMASLPFDHFLKAEGNPGFVGLADITWEDLLPGKSVTLDVIIEGILRGNSFILPDELAGDQRAVIKPVKKAT